MMTASSNRQRSIDPLWSSTTGQSHSKESAISSSNATYSEISGSTINQRILDYAPSSNWSSASTEQSFDAQATIHVQEMLEKLEAFLFRETQSLAGNTQLSEECEEWSHLFPHIRIRGHNQTPQKDQGYDLIPRTKTRACSPYFYIPPCTSRAFRVEGIKLPIESVVRQNPVLVTRVSDDTEGGVVGGVEEESLFDWRGGGGLDAVDMLIGSGGVEWKPHSIPISVTATSASFPSATGLSGLESLKAGLSDLGTVDSNTFALAVVPSESITGREEAYVQRSASFELVGAGMALVFVHWGTPVPVSKEDQEEKSVQANTRVLGDGDQICAYDVLAAFKVGIFHLHDKSIEAIQKDTDLSIYEIYAPSLATFLHSTPKSLDIYLIFDATENPDIVNCEEIFLADGEVEEYFAHDDMEDSNSDPIPPSRQAYSIRKRGLPPVTPNASIRQDIMSHVFDDLWSEVIPLFQPLLSNYRDEEPSTTNSTPTPHKKPPTTTNHLNNNQHQNPRHSRTTASHNHPNKRGGDLNNNFSNYFSDDENEFDQVGEDIEDDEQDEDEDDGLFPRDCEKLLSAMTIKSLPLQRRESSARAVSSSFMGKSFENIASVEALVGGGGYGGAYGSRPSSARPVSTGGRLAAAPNGGARPASGRGFDMYQQALQGSVVGRMQSAASGVPNSGVKSAAARSAAIKRSSTGMRLTPLSSMPPIGGSASISMNDVLFGTSIGINSLKPHGEPHSGRPSTSHGVSSVSSGGVNGGSANSKRLPPIRLSLSLQQQDLMDMPTSSVSLTQSPKSMNRHVLFDTSDSMDSQKPTRSTSPRPFSAKRQPSGGFRARPHTSTSRPHTTSTSTASHQQQQKNN
ncbi:UNVERIFIED_CONTAM: hypothetical protein HDU68_008601 [Siphonaria sp. JEL0065]|nr:hypothetical protein HDU68_008601 [Siphonaria sp. JEL0065]